MENAEIAGQQELKKLLIKEALSTYYNDLLTIGIDCARRFNDFDAISLSDLQKIRSIPHGHMKDFLSIIERNQTLRELAQKKAQKIIDNPPPSEACETSHSEKRKRDIIEDPIEIFSESENDGELIDILESDIISRHVHN